MLLDLFNKRQRIMANLPRNAGKRALYQLIKFFFIQIEKYRSLVSLI